MQRPGHYLWACSVFALASAAEAGETVTYSYDALGRLTRSTSSGTVNEGVATGIAYDPAGNRSAYNVTGVGGAPPPPPSNQSPVAVSDSFQAQRCTAATFDALANDSDANGDPLILTSVTGAAAQIGMMGIANNRLTWSPSYSSGTFTGFYTVSDGRGAAATGSFTVQFGSGGC
ncbi:MAG: Ig-like domain-containing protein [Allosphingosinicella sp.]